MTLHAVAATIIKIKEELKNQFFERGTTIDAIWLGILANEHVFVLGPPGTGKTYLTRETFDRIQGAEYFEAILSKTRPAEAILGPYDIPELREHGHLHRKYKGFLPTADYAMLDEVGKMSPTLGHDLLSVVLDRRLHQVNGGRSWVDLPLRTFVGGSNELPTSESDDAAALWDRMLVRTTVDVIQETGNFAALMGADSISTVNPTTVDFSDLAAAADKAVPAVTVPRDVIDALVQLREDLRKEEITPSDRRWRQARKLLQASAFLAGRPEAEVEDIESLAFALWDTPMQINTVQRKTLSVSNPLAEEALSLMEKANEIAAEIRKVDDQTSAQTRAQLSTELSGNTKKLVAEVGNLRQKAQTIGASTTKIDEVEKLVRGLQAKIYSDVLQLQIPTSL